jgi:hypothetical protein
MDQPRQPSPRDGQDDSVVLALACRHAMAVGMNHLLTEAIRPAAQRRGIAEAALTQALARLNRKRLVTAATTWAGAVPTIEIPWTTLERYAERDVPGYDHTRRAIVDAVKGLDQSASVRVPYPPNFPTLAVDTILDSLAANGHLRVRRPWGDAPWVYDVSPLLATATP